MIVVPFWRLAGDAASFQPGATVTFDGIAATNVAFVNSTTLIATTPAHAVDVVVHNPGGQTGTKSSSQEPVSFITGSPSDTL